MYDYSCIHSRDMNYYLWICFIRIFFLFFWL